jgi:hypothetical protein
MRERTTIPLRRAKCLFLYWRDDQLSFHNFARRLTVSASPVTCEVLGELDKSGIAEVALKQRHKRSDDCVLMLRRKEWPTEPLPVAFQ